jgi:protein disulfide-isomerase
MKPILCSLLLFTAAAGLVNASDWSTDYKAALVQAKAQHKDVLLDFTGSDWCGYCKLLDSEVFSKTSFQDYADKHYILVTVDFPHDKQLSDEVKSHNQDLSQKFQINGFPTLVVLDENGKELGRTTGYDPGSGADAVVAKLKTFETANP